MLKYSQRVRWPEQHIPERIVGIAVAIWWENCLEQCIGRVEERLTFLEDGWSNGLAAFGGRLERQR
ncbi:hypothetical protein [Natronococcus amylolyticus]|uniref:hypothetical protein n=1 Tax=Natronococcus amylolyticus TaxID=44470 RepID=UPI000677BAA5|nr:hypothetical protein [Natronococcus amylolyticus]